MWLSPRVALVIECSGPMVLGPWFLVFWSFGLVVGPLVFGLVVRWPRQLGMEDTLQHFSLIHHGLWALQGSEVSE